MRLRARRPHRVLLPPLDRLGSRKRLVVRRRVRVRRRRNRHTVLLVAQIRYPRSRTCTCICTGGGPPHTAAPAALGRRALLGRGRARLGAFGSCRCTLGGRIGDVKVALLALLIARPIRVLVLVLILVLIVLHLVVLSGRRVFKRADPITIPVPVPSSIHLVPHGRALAFLALLRGALLNDDKALLALALVPLERAGDGMEPVGALLVRAHSRERVLGCGDLDVVALLELDAPAPVERRPCCRA